MDYRNGRLPQPDLTNVDAYLEAGCEFDHDATEMLAVPDYQDKYKEKLARMHRYYPFPHDSRLWKENSAARVEETPRKEPSISLVQDMKQFLRKRK